MNNDSLNKLASIKSWLKTGSINVFGLPMSGKDTVGVRLAEDLGGKFLSSGLIIRAMEALENKDLTSSGNLIDSNVFYDWILPYFSKPELSSFPLVLSSIGRWSGEEDRVLETAKSSGHEIKAAVILNISEADVTERWKAISIPGGINDRGTRADDSSLEVFETRLKEFREKTLPVLMHYRNLGLLIEVKADADRDTVYSEVIEKLYAFSQKKIMDSRNLNSEENFF